MTYCMDASALIDAWQEWYSIDILPSFWARAEGLIRSGEMVAPIPVLWELERKQDALCQWFKDRDSMFVPLEKDLQLKAKEIANRYGLTGLIDLKKDRGIEADPFIIALAVLGGCTVVSHENARSPFKIPSVCRQYGVTCIRMPQLVREQRWVF